MTTKKKPKAPHTVAFKMAGKTMVVLNDGETWTGLDSCKLVFVPDTEEAQEAYTDPQDADHFIWDLKYDERSGVFDLEKLIMDLPASTLQKYRVR